MHSAPKLPYCIRTSFDRKRGHPWKCRGRRISIIQVELKNNLNQLVVYSPITSQLHLPHALNERQPK